MLDNVGVLILALEVVRNRSSEKVANGSVRFPVEPLAFLRALNNGKFEAKYERKHKLQYFNGRHGMQGLR